MLRPEPQEMNEKSVFYSLTNRAFLGALPLAFLFFLGLQFGNYTLAHPKWAVVFIAFVLVFFVIRGHGKIAPTLKLLQANKKPRRFLIQKLLFVVFQLAIQVFLVVMALWFWAPAMAKDAQLWLVILMVVGLYLIFLGAVYFVMSRFQKVEHALAQQNQRSIEELKSAVIALKTTRKHPTKNLKNLEALSASIRMNPNSSLQQWECLADALQSLQKEVEKPWCRIEVEAERAINFLRLVEAALGNKLQVNITGKPHFGQLPVWSLLLLLDAALSSIKPSFDTPPQISLAFSRFDVQISISGGIKEGAIFGKGATFEILKTTYESNQLQLPKFDESAAEWRVVLPIGN